MGIFLGNKFLEKEFLKNILFVRLVESVATCAHLITNTRLHEK